jgi:hypothetical protein
MPAVPQERLFVNGVLVDRDAQHVFTTRRLLHNLDGPDELEFMEIGVLQPTYPLEARVDLYIAEDTNGDDVIVESDFKLRFRGVIKQAPLQWRQGARPQINYVCTGLKYLADDVRVTHPESGKPLVQFNLTPGDQDYDRDLARLQLGEIIRRVLTYDRHATDLWYQGITAYTADPPLIDPLDPLSLRSYNTAAGSPAVLRTATLTDLATITIVPTAIRIEGDKLWSGIEDAIREFAPWAGAEIQPDGLIRFHDTRSPAWLTIQLGTDPVHPPSLSLDASECYGAVELIGNDEVEGESFQISDGSLAWVHSSADAAAWTWANFQTPKDAVSEGDIVTIGPTTVTVRPTSGALTWAANRWVQDEAFLEVILPIGPNNPSKLTESIPVLSNTACVANGTSVITLEYPLAATGYTKYRLVGQSTDPLRYVWRDLTFTDPAKAARIVERFAFPTPWEFLGALIKVLTPVGKNLYRPGSTGDPFVADFDFEIVTNTAGQRIVRARRPLVEAWSTQTELDTGGASVKAPTDVLVFAPVSRGALTLRRPPSGFAGEGFTKYGGRRVKYVPMTDWRYRGDTSRMGLLADMIHEVTRDPTISGTLDHGGLWSPGVQDANLAIKLTSVHGTTPWETTKLLVRAVEVVGVLTGPWTMRTNLQVSNQKRPYTSERYFTPAEFAPGGPLEGAAELDAR